MAGSITSNPPSRPPPSITTRLPLPLQEPRVILVVLWYVSWFIVGIKQRHLSDQKALREQRSCHNLRAQR